MPVAGARLTLATLLGAADALVVESVEGDVVVLTDGCGLHKGAKASTRIYDGERVWHLTFSVLEQHVLAPSAARVALALEERTLVGEERRLPRSAHQSPRSTSRPFPPERHLLQLHRRRRFPRRSPRPPRPQCFRRPIAPRGRAILRSTSRRPPRSRLGQERDRDSEGRCRGCRCRKTQSLKQARAARRG